MKEKTASHAAIDVAQHTERVAGLVTHWLNRMMDYMRGQPCRSGIEDQTGPISSWALRWTLRRREYLKGREEKWKALYICTMRLTPQLPPYLILRQRESAWAIKDDDGVFLQLCGKIGERKERVGAGRKPAS